MSLIQALRGHITRALLDELRQAQAKKGCPWVS